MKDPRESRLLCTSRRRGGSDAGAAPLVFAVLLSGCTDAGTPLGEDAEEAVEKVLRQGDPASEMGGAAASSSLSEPSGGGGQAAELPVVSDSGLNGLVEDLGDGRVRITYDFEDSTQGDDWIALSPNPPTAIYVQSGGLLVESRTDEEDVELAGLVRQMAVDHIAFDARIEEGSHINAYYSLVPDGSWTPAQGTGLIHRWDGINVTQSDIPELIDFAPTAIGAPVPGQLHSYSMTENDGSLELSCDASSATTSSGVFFPTERYVALGSYHSVVYFDNVVIEGKLHPAD